MNEKRELNAYGLQLQEDFEQMKKNSGGCSCHINPPCNYCLHPGNPHNLEETPEAWVVPLSPVAAEKKSHISHTGYDADHRVLAVQFSGGGLYYYCGVGADTCAELVEAESVGKFFHANIKGKFEGKKIS